MSTPFTLYLKIVQACEVKAVDHGGTSDPYCIISVANFKEKTKVIKKTLRPRWNQNFKIDGINGKDEVVFTLMDWNRFESHVFLGEVRLKISSLPEGQTKEAWYKLEPGKEGKGITGKIHILAHWTLNSAPKPALLPSVEEGFGRLFVHVKEGRNLAVKDKLSGTSDPYCILVLGNQKYKTDFIEKNLNPIWEDEEYFFEVEKDSGNLEVQVWDWNLIGSPDAMGHIIIPVKNLAPNGTTQEDWYKLEPIKKETVSGEIRLLLQYTSAKQAAKSFQIASQKYTEIERILTAPNMVIISTLVKLYDNNELIRSVVRSFSNENKVLSLVNQLIYRELKNTKSENTLFRTDSFATKSVVSFLKNEATSTLHTVLGPLIEQVTKKPNDYEVDPAKCKDEGTRKKNALNLRNSCQLFIDTIMKSIDSWPTIVRNAMSNIRKMVGSVFADSGLKAVGAFLFLRFMCPALIAPEGFDLVPDAPSKEARRALCLIAKVLQNLANLHPFKEEYMLEFDSFVQQNTAPLNQFYDQFSTITVTAEQRQAHHQSYEHEEDKIEDLALVVTHLIANLPKIEKDFSSDPRIAHEPKWLEENTVLVSQLKSILTEN